MTKIIAFMPAKGHSDRIENKNLRILDGEYLFKRKLKQLLACPLINEVVLDTDSDEIARLAQDLPVTRLIRPKELASNKTDGHELFAWEASQFEADYYIQALCTAPFVNQSTLTRAIQAIQASEQHDSLVGIYNQKQYLWKNNQPSYGFGRIPNSIDLPTTTIEAMSLYITKSATTKERRFGNNPLLFELTPEEIVDVNWPADLQLAEVIAAGHRAQENALLGALTPYLSSAMLSDITRDMRLNLTLPKEIKGRARFFGRAKTLRLGPPDQTETWQGIYRALDSYDFVRPGDVVIVENQQPDFAYFGNLNAQLAIRAGAVGAVIDGVTRDSVEVEKLGLPVYSRGHYCVDIKYQGTVKAINMAIQIGGVPIAPGDFVFADPDGVTIIPEYLWPSVKIKALETIKKEWHIGLSVALGMNASEILKEHGEF